MMMPHKLYTVAERPELRKGIGDIHARAWTPFLQEFPVASRAWDFMFTHFPEHQIAMCDEHDTVVASAHCLPFDWDGNPDTLPAGWDASMLKAMADHEQGHAPTAVTAYAIVVDPSLQGKGLSGIMLEAMVDSTRRHGLRAVAACVRPSLKAMYPLTPFERYIHWKREDGSPFDAWIRVHWRAGADIGRPEPHSMVLQGTVAEWEEWTGLKLPESGPYVITGALQPIEVDVELDTVYCSDPNVWMVHWCDRPLSRR